MSIAGIKNSSYNKPDMKKLSLDSYETNIRKQITQLQDKVNNISSDEEKTTEQKSKEKQAAQEEIQYLNNELRQYQTQKRQEEAEKKQEAVKKALEEANADMNTKGETEPVLNTPVPGHMESGVMISLSATKDQIAGMVRIRTNLEGRQRTADTEEEKAAIQKKINNLSRGIGQKVTATKDTITEYHKTIRNNDPNKQTKTAMPKTSPKKEEIFWAEPKASSNSVKKPSVADNTKTVREKPFDNAEIIIK